MSVRQLSLAVVVLLILGGCMTEQERKEKIIARELITSIREYIEKGLYDDAEQLCEDGKTRCPTVDYDWDEAKSLVNQWREWSEQREQAMAERRKAAEERAERERLAMHKTLYENTVNDALTEIRKCYSGNRRYLNPFNKEDDSDWLSKWSLPRTPITNDDALAGEVLLSEFGSKYLPNAYANYEKKREALLELQQVFNEEFPEPWKIGDTDPKWNAFNKVLEKFVKARTEYFICHDELCHYWMLSRFGVLKDEDFADVDSKSLTVCLLPENVEYVDYDWLIFHAMEEEVCEFAEKYAPESYGIYQKLEHEFSELHALLCEVWNQLVKMDDVRDSRTLSAAVGKYNNLVREMNTLSLQLQAWYTDHRTSEKSVDDVARCDAEMVEQMKPFMDELPNYIKEHALGPVIANSELITIPGKSYRMQRTEVTQLQWMLVMGNNPSAWRGPNRPVENVSWEDCQEFIKKASEMDGRNYRLPMEEEWEYACRAGSTGDWGKRRNGECGPLETMGWYDKNSGRGTHGVALKEPNAWGLFDMHGNVSEWCGDYRGVYDSYATIKGGSRGDGAEDCTASCFKEMLIKYPHNGVGFRLVVSQ